MAEEITKILTIETGRSFNNIKALRAEIRELNQVVETGTKLVADENGELQEVAVTSEEYDKAVRQLAEDKRTLADVTNLNRNAWNQEADSVDRSAKSYQQLQAEMRRLRVEWRNTSNADDRKRIAGEINDITNRLKEMDAETGFYQRNVGDYFNAIQRGLAGLPGPLSKVNAALGTNVNLVKQIVTSPILGVLALIGVALAGLAKAWKDANERIAENEDASRAAAEAMDRAAAVADIYTKKLDEMGETVAKVKAWWAELTGGVKVFFATLLGEISQAQGVFDFLHRLVDGLHDAANAATFASQDAKAEIEEQTKLVEKARLAQNAYTDAYRESVKTQAQLNKEIAEARRIAADGDEDTEKRLNAVNLAIAKTNELSEERIRLQKLRIAYLQAEAARTENSTETKNKLAEAEAELVNIEAQEEQGLRRLVAQRAKLNEEHQKEIDAFEDRKEIEAYDAEQAAEAARLMEENGVRRVEIEDATTAAIVAGAKERIGAMELENWKAEQNLKEEKRRTAAKKQLFSTYGDAVSSVMGSIADMLESSSDADEKTTKQVKALRIASAIIDTISAAVSSYNAMSGIPYVGPALGAAAAASATAMGLANIAKIRSTNVSKNDSTGGGSAGNSTPTITAPPAVVQEVPVTRTLTGASEAQAVNQAPAKTKVVLVMSELEAKQGEIASKQVETTF